MYVAVFRRYCSDIISKNTLVIEAEKTNSLVRAKDNRDGTRLQTVTPELFRDVIIAV